MSARLAIGGIAGIVATVALTSTVRHLRSRKDRIAPRPPLDALGLVAPFAYGAVCGALLAAANPRPDRIGGVLAGGGLWLAGEMGWLPAIVIGPATGRPVRRSVTMLAGHLAWGWSAAEAMREIGETR